MASEEVNDSDEREFWIEETVPFGGLPMSLHDGLHASRDPRFVFIMRNELRKKRKVLKDVVMFQCSVRCECECKKERIYSESVTCVISCITWESGNTNRNE